MNAYSKCIQIYSEADWFSLDSCNALHRWYCYCCCCCCLLCGNLIHSVSTLWFKHHFKCCKKHDHRKRTSNNSSKLRSIYLVLTFSLFFSVAWLNAMASYQLDKYIRHLLDAHSTCAVASFFYTMIYIFFGLSRSLKKIDSPLKINKQRKTPSIYRCRYTFTDIGLVLLLRLQFFFNNACLIKYIFMHALSFWLFVVHVIFILSLRYSWRLLFDACFACLPASQSVCFDTQLQASKCHAFFCLLLAEEHFVKFR